MQRRCRLAESTDFSLHPAPRLMHPKTQARTDSQLFTHRPNTHTLHLIPPGDKTQSLIFSNTNYFFLTNFSLNTAPPQPLGPDWVVRLSVLVFGGYTHFRRGFFTPALPRILLALATCPCRPIGRTPPTRFRARTGFFSLVCRTAWPQRAERVRRGARRSKRGAKWK